MQKTKIKLLELPHFFILSVLALHLSSCTTTTKEAPESKLVFEKSNQRETVVILGVNDIHGALAPEKFKTKDEDAIEYEKGGAAYFASHIKVLKKKYGSQLLLLDGGDEFQGSLDSNLEKGKPVVDFLNSIGIHAAVIGNHEFDFGAEDGSQDNKSILKKRMYEAKYPYLSANIYSKQTGKFPGFLGYKPSTILTAGRLKVGVIGLSTEQTPGATRPDFVRDLEFRELAKVAQNEAKKLKEQGAHVIVVLAHAGIQCDLDQAYGVASKPRGRVRSPQDPQSMCDPDSEIAKLLKNIPQGTVDAVVSGHTHTLVNHWIEGVPVIQAGTRLQYYNLIYLTYDFESKKVVNDLARIEGPMPVCPKVFKNQRDCSGERLAPKNGRGSLVTPELYGESIYADRETERLLEPYFEKTKATKQKVIGQCDHRVEHQRMGESMMGNLITDAMKWVTKADVAVTNTGGIRSQFEPGVIKYEDVYRTFPFDNFISKLTLSGRELKTLIRIAENGSRGFFPVSGLKLRLIKLGDEPWSSDLNKNRVLEPWEQDRLIEAKLDNKDWIEPQKMYTVAIPDFLVQGGDDFAWFMKSLPASRVELMSGPIMRDTLIDYIAHLSKPVNSDDAPLLNPNDPRMRFEARPSKKPQERQKTATRKKVKSRR